MQVYSLAVGRQDEAAARTIHEASRGLLAVSAAHMPLEYESALARRTSDPRAACVMMPTPTKSLIAVDVGNSRIKIGRFDDGGGPKRAGAALERSAAQPLPQPVATLDLPIDHCDGKFDALQLRDWIANQASHSTRWLVASVHRRAAELLIESVDRWSKQTNSDAVIRRVIYSDVPLVIRVDEPARVGIDRLLGALAAERLRNRDRDAVVIDVGTAITVDLLHKDGSFAGGAIMPGIAMSARALAEYTDALPQVAVAHFEHPPTPLGKSTVTAIEAGLYWGAVGAIRELVARLSATLAAPPEIYITGGAAPQIAELLSADSRWPVRHEPHLVLAGIAIVSSSVPQEVPESDSRQES